MFIGLHTPLGLIFRGGQGTRDRGQWGLLEETDTTSNTLDSIGYTPLGLIFRGGQETRDRGQWELLGATGTASNTLDSTGYTPLGLISRGDRGQGEGDSGNY